MIGGPRKPAPRPRIVVGISGGANSAVAAALLKSQGYDVTGVHIQVTADSKTEAFASRCCLTKAYAAAEQISRKLDIPLHRVRAEDRFVDKVADQFVHDLLQARLPNPCIACNLEIRFDELLRKADELGCTQVATGHHAQIIRDASGTASSGEARVTRAVSVQRDQSYFLFGLSQGQLSRLMFPLGGFQDVMIERLAREFELPGSSPGNPQESCLSSPEHYLAYVEARVHSSLRPHGTIRAASDGGLLGDHHGVYTCRVGQKLKLASHVKDPEQYQVVGFDLTSYAVLMGSAQERNHSELLASKAVWARTLDGLRSLRASARFSPSQREALPCRVTLFENSMIRVMLDQPYGGMCVGQAIVFYDGDEVVGGAYVEAIGAPRQ